MRIEAKQTPFQPTKPKPDNKPEEISTGYEHMTMEELIESGHESFQRGIKEDIEELKKLKRRKSHFQDFDIF